MEVLIKIGAIVLAFCAMELVAWSFHKYLMHGILWPIHRDHHQKNTNRFWEFNDFFFPVFALPGIVFIYFGLKTGFDLLWFWFGIGIALYGLAYSLVHDVIIHQRIKILTNWNNNYIRAIRRAHKIHHKHLGKENGENFGFLYVSAKYIKEMYKNIPQT